MVSPDFNAVTNTPCFAISLISSGITKSLSDRKARAFEADSSAIEAWVDEVISKNPKQVEQYRSGQTKILGFFVGQVMKLSQGKADPAMINELIKQKLI